ncbi:MAG: ABC transporter ATP-binding protein [Peptostreptococcaceae bacterium]|nr:ABC transporter ATP-binding protein [Peptostreptococcaceae bacterium]MDY5739322.1 ABC transporter ATP-binding protein [Anaerovoracaceae bacterium]
MQPLIKLQNISKSFDDTQVLDDFSLEVKENEFITLLGPSGCGKTTILRIVGGFEKPDEGRVFFEGKDITAMPPNKRHINTVFQKYALFPHMNIGQNIAFGLKISGKSDQYIRDKVKYALKLVNLSGYEKRKIDSLSGGQQQRIAIARAIVNEPKVLLLDEPLGALDLKLRQDMEYELIRLKNELGITFIYVTHDQEEALTMSDKVVVMNGGYIQQMGTPEQIYNEPENAFVADFIGDSNIIDAIMVEDRVVKICNTVFPCIDEGFGRNRPVDVVIRPEDIIIKRVPEDYNPKVTDTVFNFGDGNRNTLGRLFGTITHNVFIGVHYEMEIEAGGFTWLAQNTVNYPVGTKVAIDVIPENIQIMNKPQTKDEEAMEIDI